jgi:hypothetical protein
MTHCPAESYENAMKRLCKYCDLRESAEYICPDCRQHSHKKESAVVQHLRRAVHMKFTHDSSEMLQGCSKRRPDIFYELPRHCVIVEVDEHQHRNYADSCECARINDIVNGIGGRSVILIRYNPDAVRSNGRIQTILPATRIDLLVDTVRSEIMAEYDTFCVKIIQVWYDDLHDTYMPVKVDDITDIVSV